MGQELSKLNLEDLKNLENVLEMGLKNVRTTKVAIMCVCVSHAIFHCRKINIQFIMITCLSTGDLRVLGPELYGRNERAKEKGIVYE